MTGFPRLLPSSRVPDPYSAPTLHWGILGTGWIAHKFVQSVLANTNQRVAAVGSRSIDSAARFASAYSIPRAYGSYEELVSDPAIDIIYVASPHNFHVEHGLLAIEAGKHVLIEKPIALSSEDLERLLAAATSRGVMCQEAFWSFFLPKWDVIRQLVDDGVLGDITTVIADHGEQLLAPHRIHDASLAGGSLHDLGVYCFAVSAWAIGEPDAVRAVASLTAAGVPADAGIVVRTSAGAVASLSTTMNTTTPCRATLAGGRATLTTDDGFFFPGGFTVTEHATRVELRFDEPRIGHGALFWEAAEVARRIAAGELSTPSWTADQSRAVTRTLDLVNEQLGVANLEAR